MKRKLLSVLLIISLVFLLFSCDGSIVDIMKKMGNNVAGVNNEAVTNAVESVAVKKDSIKYDTSNGVKKFTYKNEEGKDTELFSVGKNSNNIIAITYDENTTLSLELTKATGNLSEVKSVLPPQSLDTILSTLDGNGKDELLKKLNESISDETTKKAAQGTKKVLLALIEQCNDSTDENDIVDKIIKNMKGDGELTVGDLIVLQSMTNVIADATSAVIGIVKEGKFDNAKKLLDSAYDTVVTTASIINSVSGTTTILNGIDLSKEISGLLGK